MLVYPFEDLSLAIDGVPICQINGSAEIDLDDECVPFLARLEIEPIGSGDPVVIHPTRGHKTHRDLCEHIFAAVEEKLTNDQSVLDELGDVFSDQYAAYARAECGYGHLQHERL